jgi:hypothetical protein
VLLGGIVDHDVQAAEAFDGARHRLPAERFRADVAVDEQMLLALGLDQPSSLLGVLVLVEIEDGDLGALARHSHGDGAPDAAVPTGDQRDLAGQPSGPRKTRGELRLRAHLGLATGLTILLLRGRGPRLVVHDQSPPV